MRTEEENRSLILEILGMEQVEEIENPQDDDIYIARMEVLEQKQLNEISRLFDVLQISNHGENTIGVFLSPKEGLT